MGTYVSIFLFLINCILLFSKPRKALTMFVVCILTCPVIKIANLELSYDLLFMFPLLIWYVLLGRKVKSHFGKRELKLLIVWLVLLTISSIAAVFTYDVVFNITNFLGHCRYVFYLFVLVNYGDKFEFKKALYLVVLINTVVILLQFIDPRAGIWSNELWGKASAAALQGKITLKRFPGTFNNMLPASYFFISVFVFSFFEIKTNKKKATFDLIVCLLCVLCGLFGVSKTFIMGLPIAFILVSLFLRLFHIPTNKKTYLSKALVGFCGIIAFCILFSYLMGNHVDFPRYIEKIFDGTFADTRYGEDGVLIKVIEIVKDNFLLGVGCTNMLNESFGDSQVVVLLYYTGAVGMSVIVAFILSCFYKSWRHKCVCGCVELILMTLIAFFGTTIFSPSGIVVLSYALTKTYSKRRKISMEVA